MALAAWTTAILPRINTMLNFQQIRTTYVLKRRHTAPLRKVHKQSSLRAKHYIYEVVEGNENKPQQLLRILLRKYVENVGQPGDIVSVKEQAARLLIMTQKAAYPTQENIDRYGKDNTDQVTYSSKHAATTVQRLSKFVLGISMNKETPWTLEPWHLRSAFRRAGVHVPESCMTFPKEVISGPDLSLQGKEFYVTVKINGQETVTVRCRLHHWSTNPAERLAPVRDHWKFPAELIFPEDIHIKESMPEMIPPVFDENDNYKPPVRNRKVKIN